VNLMLCFIFFDLFALFMSMHFKPQKLDIILKRIHHDLSSASSIRYRRAEVPAKVLLSIDIFTFKLNFVLSFAEIHGTAVNRSERLHSYWNRWFDVLPWISRLLRSDSRVTVFAVAGKFFVDKSFCQFKIFFLQYGVCIIILLVLEIVVFCFAVIYKDVVSFTLAIFGFISSKIMFSTGKRRSAKLPEINDSRLQIKCEGKRWSNFDVESTYGSHGMLWSQQLQ
jgi:hypothetical protein